MTIAKRTKNSNSPCILIITLIIVGFVYGILVSHSSVHQYFENKPFNQLCFILMRSK